MIEERAKRSTTYERKNRMRRGQRLGKLSNAMKRALMCAVRDDLPPEKPLLLRPTALFAVGHLATLRGLEARALGVWVPDVYGCLRLAINWRGLRERSRLLSGHLGDRISTAPQDGCPHHLRVVRDGEDRGAA